jgi:hypothetical protein
MRRGRGALSENALVTALALFVRLSDAAAGSAERELRDYLRGPFRKTLAVLDARYPDLAEAIERVDLGEWV